MVVCVSPARGRLKLGEFMASLMYIASSKTCLNENTGLGPLVPVHRTSPAPWLLSRRVPSADVLVVDSFLEDGRIYALNWYMFYVSLAFSDTILLKECVVLNMKVIFSPCVLGC